MTDRYPGAFLVSLTFHGAIVGVLLLFGYAASLSKPETMMAIELVAGEGDNFAATQAPALGEPGAPKLDLPKAAPEEPKPRETAPPEPTPVAPAPVGEKAPQKAPQEKPQPKLPDIAKALERKTDRAETRTKAAIAKEREAEQKRVTTKEEYDKQNKQKNSAKTSSAGPPKVAKIDSEGIRKGVVGGSTDNKTGGAGGKALVRDDGPVMDTYFALLQQRLRAALNKPPGLSDTLVTTIKVRINADGSLTGARIVKASGSDDFDAAAMAAVAATRMPPHPNNKSEELTIPFRMKEQE